MKSGKDMKARALRFRASIAALCFLPLIACAAEEGGGRESAAGSAAAITGRAAGPAKWVAAKGTALIVMDMQNAFTPVLRNSMVMGNIKKLVDAADAAKALVVWVYTDAEGARPGSSGFAIASPLAPASHHRKVVKTSSSAFADPELGALLEKEGVGRLVFCGLASNGCVRASVQSSMYEEYRTVVAEDAHSIPTWGGNIEDVENVNRIWREDDRIELLPTASIVFSLPAVVTRGLGAEDWPLSPGFAKTLDDSYRSILSRSPETVTQLGLSSWAGQDDSLLDGLSAEYLAENRRLEKEALAALDALDRSGMTQGDLLSADAYRSFLADSVALHDFAEMDYLVNPTVFGFAYSAESLFTECHPITSLAEAKAYVARLSALGRKADEAVDALRRREARKAIAPRLVLEASLPDLRAIASGSARYTAFYQTLEAKLGLLSSVGQSDREALLAEAERAIASGVIPAYGRLADEVAKQASKAPEKIGLWNMPKGAKYYAAILRQRTTTDLTPDEIHALGLRELERIHAEIVMAGERSAEFKGDTALAVVGAAFGPSHGVGPAEALKGYTELLRATETEVRPWFPLYPKAPVEVRTAPQGGYYQPGPIDGSRPGVFFVAEGSGANAAGMPTLLYHETVPGHHLQQAVAHELDLPVARKLLSSESYVEGWALYAERLMAEMGAYDNDPAGDIGRLQAEAFRAARLVVDTGIHAKRWSFATAVDFMVQKGLMTRGAAQSEVVRYASIPGQATTYYIGFLKLLELRERARAELGPDFDLGAFHRTVLSCGALPFDLLGRVVDRYIAEVKAGRP